MQKSEKYPEQLSFGFELAFPRDTANPKQKTPNEKLHLN